jgi:hypothetical protein
MSDDLDGLAEWRDNIESRVSTLEVTVKTQARVRAQMDRDMSDLSVKLDAQGRLLRALADTQSDHTAVLADHTARLTKLEASTERLEAGQAKVLAGVQTIISLLDGHDNLTE